jgi:hypothetical protein
MVSEIVDETSSHLTELSTVSGNVDRTNLHLPKLLMVSEKA